METKNLLDKLERIERTINIYSKNGDDLLEEINIDNISIDKLKSIVTPREGDPLLYLGYELNGKQLESFNRELGNILNIDFTLHYYILECHGIYNW